MNEERMKEIVEAARGGDKSAFTRLYQETYNRVYFYAFKLFGNQEDAADVVQDVFVKVFTGIGELKSTEAFTSWLYRITVNECKNKVRRNSKTILLEEGEEFFQNLIDEEPGLDIAMERKDVKSYLFAVIDLLPEEQKRAVLLYFYEHLTVAQIAEIEEVPEGTIKSRLAMARKKLKRAVEAEERRCGVKMYSLGAPALAAVLMEGAASCLMPLDLAQKALAGALAAVGFVEADAVHFVAVNESEAQKGFFGKLKDGIILEVKPVKIAIAAVALVLVLIFAVYGVSGCIAEKNRMDVYQMKVQGDQNGFLLNINALPEEVREKAAYYYTGFYMRPMEQVTAEMAYLRVLEGVNHYLDQEEYYMVEKEMWVDWYVHNTNLVCFFDKDRKLIAYAYQYCTNVNQANYDLELIYGFELDEEKIWKEVGKKVDDALKDVPEIPQDCFYYSYYADDDVYILDIDYGMAGLEPGSICGYSNIWMDSEDPEFRMNGIRSLLAKYYTADGSFLTEDEYDRGNWGLGGQYYGSTWLEYGDYLYNALVMTDEEGKVIGYGILKEENMQYRDQRGDLPA